MSQESEMDMFLCISGEMVLEIEKWDSRSIREVQERAPALFVYRLPSWHLSRVGIGFVIHGLKWR